MKNFFTKINTVAQTVRLTTQEKANARAAIVAHVLNTNPVSVNDVPQLSPWTHLFQFSRHIQVRYVSLVAVMLVIFGGISSAAENSLPGESLYQVKTSVNENILGLFAFTPQSKAQLHVQLAVRRLEEVQDLAASGKLDDGAKADVEQKLDQHLADLKDSLLALEQQNPATSTVVTASTSDSTATTTFLAGDRRTDLATSTDAPAGSSSEGFIAPTASMKVMTMSIVVPTVSMTSDASSTASSSLASKIKDASADLKAGADKLDTQNYSEAYALVQKATQTTQEIKTLIDDMPASDDKKADDKNSTTTSAIATTTQTATVVDSLTTTLGSTTEATSSPKK